MTLPSIVRNVKFVGDEVTDCGGDDVWVDVGIGKYTGDEVTDMGGDVVCVGVDVDIGLIYVEAFRNMKPITPIINKNMFGLFLASLVLKKLKIG